MRVVFTLAMIKLSRDCIILEGTVCQARYSDKRLFCPRSLYPFWREIWLERVAEPVATLSADASSGAAHGERGERAERV